MVVDSNVFPLSFVISISQTKKTVSFQMIPSCHTTSLFTFGEANVCMSLKHDVQGNVLDSNCVEMGVKAVEME